MTAPRAQLNHMLMDVDFFDKPTVRALGYKHTQVAVLLYVRWLMLMSRATNALVTRDAMASIAREVLAGTGTAVANFDSVLEYCLETGMIFEESPGHFTNARVVKDQESCAVKRIGAVQRQAKHREKKDCSGNALVTRLPVTDTVIDTDIEFEINIKELDTPPIREAIRMFAKKLKSQGRNLNQITLDPLLMRYAGRPKEFEAALIYSAGLTACKNLYDPPARPTARGDPPRHNKSVQKLIEISKGTQ